MDVEKQMDNIKKKQIPSTVEIYKYVRFLINVKKHSDDEVLEYLKHWNKDKVKDAIKEVKRENLKPKPKRYYVSLKEPLEENY